jgi:ABC-2 type transport system ATP-binding protein
MIRIENLSKRYDKEYVLDNLSCTIKDGSIYGLVGSNGAGKSTLLRLINGIFIPDTGTILIDEQAVFENEDLKQELVFVPDDLFFYPNYTLLDTAKYYQAMYKKFDMEYLTNLANTLKLDLNRKISTFSKGMKRQCALICALSTRCKYMFFDETFDGLDPVIRNTMKKIIAKQMDTDNTTIVMTSHNLRELEDICDNLGLLHKGGILFESDIDTIKTNMYKVQISLKDEFSKDSFKNLEVLS